jgi:hypothetical protein
MTVTRRRLFAGASAGGALLLSRTLACAQDAQGANLPQPNFTMGESVQVDQIFGQARQLGFGSYGTYSCWWRSGPFDACRHH